MSDDGPCPKPDPVEVRKFEKRLRSHFWNLSGGGFAIIGWISIMAWGSTTPLLSWWQALPLMLWATHSFGSHVIMYFAGLALIRDRNFWRKSATHGLEQLHTAVMRDINEGEGWKR